MTLRASDVVRIAVPFVLIGGFVVAMWKLGYFQLEHANALDSAAGRAHRIAWVGPLFVMLYVAVAAFAAPVAPLAYLAGALFGLLRGSIYVWIAALLGGTAGYWLARGIWSDTAKRLLGHYHDKLHGVGRRNAFFVTLTVQLSPLVPFGVFNYAAGAAELPYGAYLAGTSIGIVPGSVAAVYVGDRIIAGLRGGGRTAFLIAGGVMLALIAVSFLPSLVKKLRRRDRAAPRNSP